ncbi:MAG: hypothetical protein GDA45_06490 [Chromatiales bacterium]|nr:hypothetical protein [Chromatiales bacterium]
MPPTTDIPFKIRVEKEPLSPTYRHCLATIALQKDAPEDTIRTNLNPIRQTHSFENWYATQPIDRGQYGKISYAYNDDVLFGHATLYQKALADDLRAIYKDLVALLNSTHYALLRAWHYLPSLDELDDYQVFCDARARAFATLQPSFYCAATVIGTHCDYGVIYFLATRKAGITINNPRQTLPHLYPKRYGQAAPRFARATLKQWGNQSDLYISGTAAIVGHESMHEGDADAQLAEVLRNVETLLDEASTIGKMQFKHLQHSKLYVDHSIVGNIAALIDKYFPSQNRLQVFEGQMCRRELLVEMEAMATADSA